MPDEVCRLVQSLIPRDSMQRSPVARLLDDVEFRSRQDKITSYWAFMSCAYPHDKREAYDRIMEHPMRKFKWCPRYFMLYEMPQGEEEPLQ